MSTKLKPKKEQKPMTFRPMVITRKLTALERKVSNIGYVKNAIKSVIEEHPDYYRGQTTGPVSKSEIIRMFINHARRVAKAGEGEVVKQKEEEPTNEVWTAAVDRYARTVIIPKTWQIKARTKARKVDLAIKSLEREAQIGKAKITREV